MSRRSGVNRRAGGGGGGGSGVAGSGQPASPSAVLGANYLADWDARYNSVPSGTRTWTDLVGLRTLTQTSATPPDYITDAAAQNQPCWDFTSASGTCMDTGPLGAAILGAGVATFYLSMVFRTPSTAVVTDERYLELLDSGATAEVAHFRKVAAAGGDWNIYWNPAPGVVAVGPSNTSLHRYELFINGTDLVQSLDGADAVIGTGATTAAALQRVSVGAFPGSVLPATVRLFDVRIASGASAAQRALLRAYDRYVWGTL